MTTSEVNDAVQSLTRVIAASARLTAFIAAFDRLRDVDEELPHIRANLDHVEALFKEARK